MDIEYKTVGVTGVIDTSMKDGPGVVTAIVSVTGIEDNVNDVIEPGAYEDSLVEITPKGAWHHDWTTPVSKTLLAKELMPGDPMLPDKLPNGKPWPEEAGALMIKMQFNLDTQRGREAHSDVLFFGDQQEWSIGYKVPDGGARHVKNAVGGMTRHISKLRCYEYSPVLFGAMPAARTASVKDAQLSFKSLMGVDLSEFTRQIALAEAELDGAEEKGLFSGLTRAGRRARRAKKYAAASAAFHANPTTRNTNRLGMASYRHHYGKAADDDLEYDDYDEDDEDEELDLADFDPDDMDDEEKAALEAMGVTPQDLRAAISVMTKMANFLAERKDETATIDDVDAALIELEALDFDSTADAVQAIEGLTEDQTNTLLDLAEDFDSATDTETREALLDALADELDSPTAAADEEVYDGLRVVARVAGDLSEVADDEKSSRMFGVEYKALARLTDRTERQRAYLTELKSQRPDILDALLDAYEPETPVHALITQVKGGLDDVQTKDGSFTIDLSDLAELKALTS